MSNVKLSWQPLEANPVVMSEYAKMIGLSEKYEFVDVLSLDLLMMIPRPCFAFIFLFPVGDDHRETCAQLQSKETQDETVYFMKQTIKNACGTMALIHSIANNQHREDFIKQDSVLHKLFTASKNLTPDERGKMLEDNEDMCNAHGVSAREGQSREIAANESVDLHFVAIVNIDGKICELDGVKPGPVYHGGRVQENDFVDEAAAVCRKFIIDIQKKNPDESRFSIVALCKKD